MGSRTNAVNKGKQAGSIHGLFVFLKIGQSRPLFIYFRPFLITIKYRLKKRRCCTWGSNPGLQDGKHRRIRRAWSISLLYATLNVLLHKLYNQIKVPCNFVERAPEQHSQGNWPRLNNNKTASKYFPLHLIERCFENAKSFRIFAPQSTGKYYYCNQQTFTQTLGTAYFLLRQYKLPNCKLFSTRDYFK